MHKPYYVGQYREDGLHDPHNIPTDVLEPVVGLTIKAPSDPTAKKVLAE